MLGRAVERDLQRARPRMLDRVQHGFLRDSQQVVFDVGPEGPAAVVDASVKRHGNRAVAEAFLEYIRSEEAQRILADYGFRPLNSEVQSRSDSAPMPEKLFTMADLGGWAKNKKEVFETGGVWDRLFTGPSRKGIGR